jgi:hypothetical protein
MCTPWGSSTFSLTVLGCYQDALAKQVELGTDLHPEVASRRN